MGNQLVKIDGRPKNKCLKMYMVIELWSLASNGTQEPHDRSNSVRLLLKGRKNPPFPAWKDGLSEVWN